jgi:hypothetical protein
MLIIRGDRRVADIYVTEFNRLSTTITSVRSPNRPARAVAATLNRACSSPRRTRGWKSTSRENSNRTARSLHTDEGVRIGRREPRGLRKKLNAGTCWGEPL